MTITLIKPLKDTYFNIDFVGYYKKNNLLYFFDFNCIYLRR